MKGSVGFLLLFCDKKYGTVLRPATFFFPELNLRFSVAGKTICGKMGRLLTFLNFVSVDCSGQIRVCDRSSDIPLVEPKKLIVSLS